MPRHTSRPIASGRIEMIEAILKRLAPTQTERHPQIAATIERQVFGGCVASSRGRIKGVQLPSSVLQRAFVKVTEQVREGGKSDIESLGGYLTRMLLNIARDSRVVDPRPAREESRAWGRQLRTMLRTELAAQEASGNDLKKLGQLRQLLASRGTQGRAAEGERWIKAAEQILQVRAPRRSEREDPDTLRISQAWNEGSDQRRYQCATLLRWAARERGKPGAVAARRLEVLLGVCSLVASLQRLPKSTEVHRFLAGNDFVPHDPKDLLHRKCSLEKNCGGCRIVRLDLEWCKSAIHALDDPSSDAPNFAALRDFDLALRGRAARDRHTTLTFLQTHLKTSRVAELRTAPVGSEVWSTAARELTALGRELRKRDTAGSKG